MAETTFTQPPFGEGRTADTGNAQADRRTEPKTVKQPAWLSPPVRAYLVLIAISASLIAWLAWLYGAEIIRDHRHAGTYRIARDIKVEQGSCQRVLFLVTFCLAEMSTPIEINGYLGKLTIYSRAMVSLTETGGQPMVAMRSSIEPTAVGIKYMTEDSLLNRTLTLLFLLLPLAYGLAYSLFCLTTGRYVGGGGGVAGRWDR